MSLAPRSALACPPHLARMDALLKGALSMAQYEMTAHHAPWQIPRVATRDMLWVIITLCVNSTL